MCKMYIKHNIAQNNDNKQPHFMIKDFSNFVVKVIVIVMYIIKDKKHMLINKAYTLVETVELLLQPER